jgi:anhydro-N-acetylmuramic acid kinase
MTDLYLGLISGTSVDGVDVVLTEFGSHSCRVLSAMTSAYPPAMARRIDKLITVPSIRLTDLGSLDVAVGRFFGDSALGLLKRAGVEPNAVKAIGHHGQTVYHKPEEPEPFTMQIGDPSSVAAVTGIPTVADFRSMDMACGGQGAPLAPAFHDWLFRDPNKVRMVVNIGGIANLTALIPGTPTIGYDTGPGNTLLDLNSLDGLGEPYDRNGDWARQGRPNAALLDQYLKDPYFALPAPKSTGRELFNAAWNKRMIEASGTACAGADLQATLTELTALSLRNEIRRQHPSADVVICGGGAHNGFLLERIARHCDCKVTKSATLGLDPDWVEGAAFAWLARNHLLRKPGNLPTVTGARQAGTLGGLYFPP